MKVLYLEDNPHDALIVKVELRKRAPDIELDIVGTLGEALTRLERFKQHYLSGAQLPELGEPGGVAGETASVPRYDIILTDLNLPDGTGTGLLAEVRSQQLPLPVVVITGFTDEEMLLTLLRAGADDYVIKRDNFAETLALVLGAALDKFRNETCRRAAPLRILYVEPNEENTAFTKVELASIAPHLHIEAIHTAEEVFRRFEGDDPKITFDVLLLGHRLPGVSVTDILKELCQVRGLDLPIILIINRGDEEIARQSLKLGAADYVIKNDGYLHHLSTIIENAWLRAETSRRERSLLDERARLSLATEAAAIGIWEWDVNTGEIIWDERMYDIFGAARGSPVTYDVWKSYIHPDDLPGQEAQLAKMRTDNGPGHLDFRILRADQAVRYLQVARAVKQGASGAHRRVVGTAIDITEQKHAELAIQQHAKQQGLIAAFGQQALASTDLNTLWDQVAAFVSEGLNVEFAKALQLAPDNRSLILKAGIGWEKEWIGCRICATYENTLNRFILASHRPVIVNDFRSESRFKPSEILTRHGIRSSASVLISGMSQPYGVLGAYSRHEQHFTPSCFNFLQSLANILATAIDRKTTEERLTYLAQFDPLTELPNRTLFLDRLEQAMEHSQRNHRRIGVIFADLDRFKIVNDTMGHGTGDQLLVQVAQRLRQCVRSCDTVARLGGDEFALILSDLSQAEDATVVAEKVISALSLLFELEGQEVYISASLGISIYPGDGMDPDSLLRNADTAMFQAKEQGPAIYQFYLPQMNERAVARLRMETQLRGALARREFVLHYQPKVSLVTGKITGFEALLRWQHPTHGLVPPFEFISVLEDTGLIVSVGEWVVQTVCEQIRQWQNEGLAPHPVSVNLSARQFQQQDLDRIIDRTLRATEIDPRLLEFELTESVLMKEAETAANALQNLKSFGVQISMDDFGTGYSSLAYLKRFPLDVLKIDRAFIRDVTTDADDATITVAMINLAHSLGLKVVAEGVETRAQLLFLIENGCDEMQGYYFSTPLPLDVVSKALSEGHSLVLS